MVQHMTWWRAHSDDLLLAHSDDLLLQYNLARLKLYMLNSREPNASDDGPLSVDEFAHLACILMKREEARRAPLNSQLDWSRAQPNRMERRDYFSSL
jgi:hypothetical protein